MDDFVSFGPSDQHSQTGPWDGFGRSPNHIDSAADLLGRPSGTRGPGRLRVAGMVLAITVAAAGAASGVRDGSSDQRSIEHVALVPPPADGWRWEFYRDIRVQVPSSWRYDLEPPARLCAADGRRVPSRAYVSFGVGEPTVATGRCRDPRSHRHGPPATANWVPHLAVDDLAASNGAGTVHRGAWWVVRRSVGHVLVKAVSRDRTIADRIAASAERVNHGSRACSTTSGSEDPAFPRMPPELDLTAVDRQGRIC